MASKPQRRRCAVYTRKSTEEGLDQAFNSLDAQREACAAYVLSQQHEGWTLVPGFYDDGGYSGGTMDRPGLAQLLRDVKAGLVDVVVVYKIDRLTRSLADFAKIVDVLDAAGASFVSVTQAFSTTTSMGRLTLNVLLSFAQFEREVIAERIRDKIAASKARGMWMGGPAPLGYKVDNRKLVIVEDEAAIVRGIMRRYLAATSVRDLLVELTRDGVVTKRLTMKDGTVRGGVPFRRGSLFWLLSNPIYLGKLRHKDTVHKGEHQAIIDPDLFATVQAKLAMNTNRPRANPNMPSGSSLRPMRQRRVVSLLAGMVVDGQGRPMSPCHTSNHGQRYRYYASNQSDGSRHPAQRLPAGDLESAVRATLVAFLTDAKRLHAFGEHLDVEAKGSLLVCSSDLAAHVQGAGFAELRDLLGRLLVRIRVAAESATMMISAEVLFEQFELADPAGPEITLDLPASPASYGHELRLRLDPPSDHTAKPDEKLVHLIARGFAARDRLVAITTEELSAMPENEIRHIERIARLAYLDPGIVRAILQGSQPKSISARSLWRMAALPLAWEEQRSVLGFGAA
jgi:site-specific DNA recombinase